MPRYRPLLLAVAALAAAVPARAEGVAGPYVPGDEYNHGRPGERPLYGWNPFYYPEVYRPQPDPYLPPGTSYQKVWIDNRWQYLPITSEVVTGGGVIQASPATPITTSVATNVLPYTGPGVTIKLEEEVGGSVNYLIDGKEAATIKAGHQQTLTSKGRYEIRFSRGTTADGRTLGEGRYAVTEGTYFFTVTDKGWDLLRDQSQPSVAATPAQPPSPSGLTTTPLPATDGATKAPPAPAASPAPGGPAPAKSADL